MPRNARNGSAARNSTTDKREAILRAAIKVFAGFGYFNSKVSDIAAEAGIADGTVYLYFKSKEDILHSIFDRAMAEFISEGRRELAKLPEPREKLARIAEVLEIPEGTVNSRMAEALVRLSRMLEPKLKGAPSHFTAITSLDLPKESFVL